MWLVDPWSLAGVVKLLHVPHDLSKVMPRVVAICFAQVRFAQEIAPVRLALALAGDTQLGEVGLAGDHHGAAIFCFGVETNGLIQDASFLRLLLSTVLGAFDVVDAVPLVTAVLSLSVSGPNKTDQKESSTAYGSHDGGVKGTLEGVGGAGWLYKYKSHKGVFEQGRVYTSLQTGGPLVSSLKLPERTNCRNIRRRVCV